jgi:uncharacterized membrane protein
MTWLQRYRVRHYFGNSIWILPMLGTLAAVGAVRVLHLVEQAQGWTSPLDPDTARAVVGTVASSLFTSIVFVCSSLLVAVQLASAALTPRIIALVFRDPVTKFSLTVLVFTFAFSLAALLRITAAVPLLTAHVAVYASLVSLGVFFYLIDHLGKALRPSGALRVVARLAHDVIAGVYPQRLAEGQGGTNGVPPREGSGPESAPLLGGEPTATVPSDRDGVVLAFDEAGLLALARRADCVLELVPQVGDHVTVGDPLFRVSQGGAAPPAGALCQSVAIGQERTHEQDPTFAFRIMVDIASKGLSPAINDPTTAVLAVDAIHSLLRSVGQRRLRDGQVRDPAGRLRLVYRTPDWEDFVYLAVTEIRQFGGASIQIARRLRAMLENLLLTLPESRAPLLRQELAMLHRSSERFFAEPEDQALAKVSDYQGVGGKHDQHQRRSGMTSSASAPSSIPTGIETS